jgi:hypothetical protein
MNIHSNDINILAISNKRCALPIIEINQKYEGETYFDRYDNKSSNKNIRCRKKYKNRIIPKFENTDVSLIKNAEFSEE